MNQQFQISDEQARHIASIIIADVRRYAEQHQGEFEEFVSIHKTRKDDCHASRRRST